jgi:hypothetical protein
VQRRIAISQRDFEVLVATQIHVWLVVVVRVGLYWEHFPDALMSFFLGGLLDGHTV